MTTFQLECGCLLNLDDEHVSAPCLVHEHEEITPLEAMVMVCRTQLMEESEAEAFAFILQKRDELNGGKPVFLLPPHSAHLEQP